MCSDGWYTEFSAVERIKAWGRKHPAKKTIFLFVAIEKSFVVEYSPWSLVLSSWRSRT
jgi:hypothetical protein